jgi:hypothetical protein
MDGGHMHFERGSVRTPIITMFTGMRLRLLMDNSDVALKGLLVHSGIVAQRAAQRSPLQVDCAHVTTQCKLVCGGIAADWNEIRRNDNIKCYTFVKTHNCTEWRFFYLSRQHKDFIRKHIPTGSLLGWMICFANLYSSKLEDAKD